MAKSKTDRTELKAKIIATMATEEGLWTAEALVLAIYGETPPEHYRAVRAAAIELRDEGKVQHKLVGHQICYTTR